MTIIQNEAPLSRERARASRRARALLRRGVDAVVAQDGLERDAVDAAK